jgi:hypothetical protein
MEPVAQSLLTPSPLPILVIAGYNFFFKKKLFVSLETKSSVYKEALCSRGGSVEVSPANQSSKH